ncbi:MAG: response regulator transcription factor [Verrucomicrobiia bacterium]|jgi:DNA-binding NarL/FixJ family response regulator
MAAKSVKKTITILLADDHPVVREGIRSCLAAFGHLNIVGEACNGQEAIDQAKALQPNIVLMDINMPLVNGIEATRAIATSQPKSRVVILTVVNSQQYVAEMIRSGAKGYVLKDAHPEELVEAIDEVNQGKLYFEIREDTPNPPPPAIPPSNPGKILSGREIEVLTLVASGQSSKDIALGFDVSVRTVKTYRERIMRKTGLHSVAEMTKYAVETGLLNSGSPEQVVGVSVALASRQKGASKKAVRKKVAKKKTSG